MNSNFYENSANHLCQACKIFHGSNGWIELLEFVHKTSFRWQEDETTFEIIPFSLSSESLPLGYITPIEPRGVDPDSVLKTLQQQYFLQFHPSLQMSVLNTFPNDVLFSFSSAPIKSFVISIIKVQMGWHKRNVRRVLKIRHGKNEKRNISILN